MGQRAESSLENYFPSHFFAHVLSEILFRQFEKGVNVVLYVWMEFALGLYFLAFRLQVPLFAPERGFKSYKIMGLTLDLWGMAELDVHLWFDSGIL
jgi:hypothetical protein